MGFSYHEKKTADTRSALLAAQGLSRKLWTLGAANFLQMTVKELARAWTCMAQICRHCFLGASDLGSCIFNSKLKVQKTGLAAAKWSVKWGNPRYIILRGRAQN